MCARRLILGLAALATIFAGTSFAAEDNPYNYKMHDPSLRRSTRSYSVAPGGTGTNYVMRRTYGYRIMGFNQNTHFRADHKVPGLYLTR